MRDRAVGVAFLGFFVLLLVAIHFVGVQTFGSVWQYPSTLWRAAPVLNFAAFACLGLGCFYFWRNR